MATKVLESFMKEVQSRKARVNGAVLIQGGRVIDEIYRGNYTADTKTRMYSTTKSVTAIAIGKLVGEGRVSLDDKVVDIFADKFDPASAHPLLREQTVRQMLTMTTVYSKPTYTAAISDWLASYFRAEPTHPAGTLWHYDSCGSYVLGAIVKHITGLDFVSYLRPELDIMGVSADAYCLEGPDGEAWVSSGFIATTADLAKLAYLLLNGGRWQGQQLIPEGYARDAISPLVNNADGASVMRFNCGYGYQIWSHPGGAFAFRGLGGQIAIGYPGRDLVFACISDTSGHPNAYYEIFDSVEKTILPEFPIINAEAHERMLPKPITANCFDEIKGKKYALGENPMGIDYIRFDGDGERISFSYTKGGETKSIDFVVGEERDFIFPEKYSGGRLFDKSGYLNYKCVSTAEWLEERKLFVKIWAEDIYVGNMTMCFAFDKQGRVAVKMDKFAQFFFDEFVGVAWGKAE